MYELGITNLSSAEAPNSRRAVASEVKPQDNTPNTDATVMKQTSMSLDSQTDTLGRSHPPLEAPGGGTNITSRPCCRKEHNASPCEDAGSARRIAVGAPIAERLETLTGSVVHGVINTELIFQTPPGLSLHQRPFLTPPRKSSSIRQGYFIPASGVFSMSPGGAASLSPSMKSASNGSFTAIPKSPSLPLNTWDRRPMNTVGGGGDYRNNSNNNNNVMKCPPGNNTVSERKIPQERRDGSLVGRISNPSPFGVKLQSLTTNTGTSTDSSSSSKCTPPHPHESVCMSVSASVKTPSSVTDDAGDKGSMTRPSLHDSASSANKSNVSSMIFSGANSNTTTTTTTTAGGGGLRVSSQNAGRLYNTVPRLSFPSLVSSSGSRGSENPLRFNQNNRGFPTETIPVSGTSIHAEQRSLLTESSPQAKSIFPHRMNQMNASANAAMQQPERKTRSVQELLVRGIVSQLRPL